VLTPHLYLWVVWVLLSGLVRHGRKPWPVFKASIWHDLRIAASRWTTGWAVRLWWWIAPLLQIEMDLRLEDVRRSLAKGEQLILVANHQSTIDAFPLLIVAHELGLHPTWAAKKILFWVPGLGQALWLMGAASLDRKGKKQDHDRMLEMSLSAVINGQAVGILPEGHRLGNKRTAERRVGKVYHNGFLLCVKGAPTYRMLVIIIDSTAARAKTMMDAQGLVGSRMTVDVELHDSISHLPEDQQKAWLLGTFERINQLLISRSPT